MFENPNGSTETLSRIVKFDLRFPEDIFLSTKRDFNHSYVGYFFTYFFKPLYNSR